MYPHTRLAPAVMAITGRGNWYPTCRGDSPLEASTPQLLPALSAPAYTALPPGTTEGRRRALLECRPLSLSRMSRRDPLILRRTRKVPSL
jgi:hypothetical protein